MSTAAPRAPSEPATPELPADGLAFGAVESGESGHRAGVTVAADSPWFAGHFPGRPVLPAIAHVEIAYRLHRVAGERGYLAGVDAMRFSEPVRPGDRLVAHLTACDEAGRGRFRLSRAEGDVEISSGAFLWGSPSADEVPDPAEGEDAPPATPAELPHDGPARLLDRVALLGDGHVIGEGRVGAAHAAVHEGRVPIVLAVEVAAQAAAQVPQPSSEGPAEGAAAAGRLGYLVRLRDVRFARTEIEVDATLLASVELAGRTGPLARFDFVVGLPSGEPLAAGSLATWELTER